MAKSGSSSAIVKPAQTAVDKFSEGLGGYLVSLGLPVDRILVSADERGRVIANLPDLVELVDPAQRAEAMYVSKFVAACAAGLFDAALNFLWDEVVTRLRSRVARFDLRYFFDTAITDPQERQDYNTEEDLRSLGDATLIRGALKCGMLTDVGYRHLDYIREMRNWASAAHPNHAELTGFQLVAWFETCLKEVILREPEGAVLEVGRLLRNLREQTLQAGDVPSIAASVRKLPPELIAALLRSIVGLYCDPRQDVRVRDNIKLVASHIWKGAPDSARGEIGLKYSNYAANGDIDRKRLAHEFLELVDGLMYLPETDLALEIQEHINRLEAVHDAMNNFYNEPPLARQLRKLVPPNGAIPTQINDEYVRVLVRCRTGRTSGPARGAEPIYEELIGLFDDAQLTAFVNTLQRPEIASRLADPGCASRYKAITQKLLAKAVALPMKRVLEAIIAATPIQLPQLWKDVRFQRLVTQL